MSSIIGESKAGSSRGLTGVVLAGGASSRMGVDKRDICVRNDRDMLEQTLHVLSRCTERVFVSCREDSIPPCVRAGRYRCILDALPGGELSPAQTTPPHIRAVRAKISGPTRSADNGIGPLAGMYACLRTLGGPLLVLSCDLPFMTEEMLHCLIAARNATIGGEERPLMTTFRQAETGFIEALVAIYEAEALPLFAQAIRDGVRKLNMVIPESRRTDVYYTQTEALPFFNVNYPADLALARQASRARE